ncbi:MAG: iron-containing alcohol dehydrogenase [Oscillospiraceae bacterium]|nr:iron-containing alcohol dehydrogenase [Oscillospiraceae bacterium]
MKTDSYMPVKIISGRGCVKENSHIFSRFGKRCLIVTGGASAEKCGALSDCVSALKKEKIEYDIFNKIEPNPKTSTCFAAGVKARETGAEFIVGIGGGSPMDASKAVAIYAACPEICEEDIYLRNVPSKALPVVLIGTTSGTGSEVTGVSVLSISSSGKKKSISGEDCYAKVSFCDYGYTLNIPEDITMSTALDAFAHAAESILADTSNEINLLYAEKAVSLLKDYILSLGSGVLPSEKERETLYTASIFAGLALNVTGTCFPHTLGYYLTEKYNVPHGKACAAFMPELFIRAKKYCPEKLGTVEKILGVSAEELIKIIGKALCFDMKIEEAEAESACASLKGEIKNFIRSPGGFTADDAKGAFMSFCSYFI